MGWGKRRDSSIARDAYEVEDEDLRHDRAAAEPRGAAGAAKPTIGPSLHFQGELTGHEDVVIDGRVEGKIDVQDHTLTVGPNAIIKATIHARCVIIEGEVVGDVTADDKVEVTATGSLVGNIRAGRVVLAEDARFKGSIDMGWSEEDAEPAPAPKQASAKAPPAASAFDDADEIEELVGATPARSSDGDAGAAKAGLSAMDWGKKK